MLSPHTSTIVVVFIMIWILFEWCGALLMKYVVTGGAGFIGSNLVEALADTYEVTVIDDFSTGKRENLSDVAERVDVIQGSITDLPLLKNTFENADGVFHLAALVSVVKSVDNPSLTHETNLTGTLNVLLAARDCGVRKVVFSSSSAVYGNDPTLPKRETMVPAPLSPYAISKLGGEYYCSAFSELYDLETVSLRYFNVYGHRQDPRGEYAAVIPKFIEKLKNHEAPVIYGDGTQTRDFVYVKDVVLANIRAMQAPVTGTFNIGSGYSTDLNTLAAELSGIMKTVIPPVYEPARPGEVKHSVSDITAASTTFGYCPHYPLMKGLEQTVFSAMSR
jgi:UDP-glucose 4-epimerase